MTWKNGAAASGLILIAASLVTASCAPLGKDEPTAERAATPATGQSALLTERCRPADLEPLEPSSRQGGSVVLARRGGQLLAYVADADERAIHTVDVERGEQRAVTPLAGSPSQVLALADGRIAVTLRDQNRVELWAAGEPEAPLTRLCGAATAAEPVALAADGANARLAVSSSLGAKLMLLDSETLDVVQVVTLQRDPRAVVLSESGGRAWVTHGTGGQVSVVDWGQEATVRALGLSAFDDDLSRVRPVVQSHAFTTLAMSDGAAPRLFVPGVAVSPGDAVISRGYGGVEEIPSHRPLVSVVDPATSESLTTHVSARKSEPFTFGDVRGHRDHCLLPRAVVASAERKSLLVACIGSDQLVEYDARAVDPSRARKRFWRVPDGPTGVAVESHLAVVWSQFARQLTVLDLDEASASPRNLISTLRRQEPTLSPLAERGRSLFHQTYDTRISQDGRACASCHPDGRDDGLTWSTPNGPRQTIMLAGRLHESAPFSWQGDHADLNVHLRDTMQALDGTGLHQPKHREDLEALLAYLVEMTAPTRQGEWRSMHQQALAAVGQQLYSEAACDSCHVQGRDDGERHSVAELTGNLDLGETRVDTPSLQLIGASAPYFHDGRYATLDEMLKETNGTMGNHMDYGPEGRRALAAYLETL